MESPLDDGPVATAGAGAGRPPRTSARSVASSSATATATATATAAAVTSVRTDAPTPLRGDPPAGTQRQERLGFIFAFSELESARLTVCCVHNQQVVPSPLAQLLLAPVLPWALLQRSGALAKASQWRRFRRRRRLPSLRLPRRRPRHRVRVLVTVAACAVVLRLRLCV